MKYIVLLLGVLFSAVVAQGQVRYEVEGYCGTTKLTDIKAKWGEAAFTTKVNILAGSSVKQFVFDYGQMYKKDKEAIICDKNGEVITFSSVTHLLNFMEFNGWAYKETIDHGGSYVVLFYRKSQAGE